MTNYPSNLTESQYRTILGIIGDTRKRKRSLKEIFDAIFYLLKTGCQWRMLPADFPNWKLVHYYFHKWSRDGTLEMIHEVLHKRIRQKRGRHPQPSMGLIDSQSVKTTKVGGRLRRFLRKPCGSATNRQWDGAANDCDSARSSLFFKRITLSLYRYEMLSRKLQTGVCKIANISENGIFEY